MEKGEIVTLLLTLTTIGMATIGALIRQIFLGLKSRQDKLEGRVEEYHTKCMDEIIRLTKERK